MVEPVATIPVDQLPDRAGHEQIDLQAIRAKARRYGRSLLLDLPLEQALLWVRNRTDR